LPLTLTGAVFVALEVLTPIHTAVSANLGDRTAAWLNDRLTDLTPTEYRADAVVTLTAGDSPVLAVVVEAQLRADAHKRRTWPAYIATLHARWAARSTCWWSAPTRPSRPGARPRSWSATPVWR